MPSPPGESAIEGPARLNKGRWFEWAATERPTPRLQAAAGIIDREQDILGVLVFLAQLDVLSELN